METSTKQIKFNNCYSHQKRHVSLEIGFMKVFENNNLGKKIPVFVSTQLKKLFILTMLEERSSFNNDKKSVFENLTIFKNIYSPLF